MALSLAQRTQLRARAAMAAEQSSDHGSMEGATAYELQLAALHQDRLRLKGIQSLEAKAELKRELLPKYEPYIQGVLDAGQGAQDEVLATVMLWHIDVADYAQGLKLAEYVLNNGLSMPDRFERTTGCLVAEEIAEAALKALRNAEPFDTAILDEVERVTASHDMPDEVRAKLYFARGLAAKPELLDEPSAELIQQVADATALLNRAIELFERVGAKTERNALEKWLKKHAASADNTPPAS